MTPTTPVLMTKRFQPQSGPPATELFCPPSHWLRFWEACRSFQFNGFYSIPQTLSTCYAQALRWTRGTQTESKPGFHLPDAHSLGTRCFHNTLPSCLSFFRWCLPIPGLSLLPATEVPARHAGDLSGVSEIPLCPYRPLDLQLPRWILLHICLYASAVCLTFFDPRHPMK